MTASGQYQTAVANSFILISTDYGNSWSPVSDSSNNWTAVAVSASGQYQVAVTNDSNGSIYTSICEPGFWSATGATGLYCPYNLYVDGSNGVTAPVFNATSDYRIKHNVLTLNNNTYNVNNIRPVIYKNLKTLKQDIGVIAHELQEHYPFLVDGEKDGENLQSVNYIGLIPVLIKEIQELKKELKQIKEILNTH